ncbi:endonuclease/exonuclease/phosphatase family protein [Ferrimonas balearica]|uniref:endonuclease/exonuclease/phosphatase family protein n=1 Tax=Ferrimonas balearica TaxID=44012 RepID=UPI001C991976|nr:endonuclease/exonuclease/phosphatase family protein [Ferrimonas balearica]MBY5920739.1 endonuclease/exonuclease/phosphatase family protein [Ferrimonas balearica]MBY5996576.1 endonuclease/exonuclease/phosphatase family protein [Ferrimonas balearica]
MRFFPILASLLLALSLSGCPMPPEHAITLDLPAPTAQALPDDDLRLLNWNIYKQLDNPQWQHEFGGLMNEYRPQLVTLQETNLPSVLMPPLTAEHGYVFAPNLVLNERTLSGVMTAATISPMDQLSLLSDVTEPISNTPKVALLTEYQLEPSGKVLLVANIHAINFVSNRDFSTQVKALERRLSKHRGPIILSGDFNTWSSSRLALLGQATVRLGLQPVSFSNDERTRFFGSPLDHIFHSVDLAVIPGSAQVFDNTDSSDHRPMVVGFRYQGAGYADAENGSKLETNSLQTVE